MPYLEVTYTDPQANALQVEVTTLSTVQVISNNKVDAAFALDGVASVALNPGDIPEAPVAAPVEVAPDPTPEIEPDPVAVEDPAPADPVVETAPADPEPVADEPLPVDPETVTTDTTDPHTTAVLSAIGTLDSAIAVAGDVSNDETTVAAHVAQAQTDIAELLTQYPDSAPLLDAKNQIDALAENFAPPTAA